MRGWKATLGGKQVAVVIGPVRAAFCLGLLFMASHLFLMVQRFLFSPHTL